MCDFADRFVSRKLSVPECRRAKEMWFVSAVVCPLKKTCFRASVFTVRCVRVKRTCNLPYQVGKRLLSLLLFFYGLGRGFISARFCPVFGF